MLWKIIALLLFTAFFSACDANNFLNSFLKKEKEKTRIGLSIPTLREARWQRDLKYLKESAVAADA